MEAVTIGQAQKLTSPNPFALLTVSKPGGGTNVMAISWWSYASNHPAAVTACLSAKGYSGQCIQECGHFGLSVVGPRLKEAAMGAGSRSGRDRDKAGELGIPLESCEGFSQEMVSGSRLWISCKLKDTLPVGDHILYVGEVEALRADPAVEGLYAWDGYARLDTVR